MNLKRTVGRLFYKAADAAFAVATGVSLTDMRLGAFLAGGPTFSGQTVSVDSAMQLDTVWACVRLISETIASLPLKLYQHQANDTSVLARNHPLYAVLATSPNADMTPIEFWGVMVACLLTWGNAFGQVMRRADGTVIAINPLRPDRMTVRRDPNTGEPIYTYSWQGKYLVLGESDIFHIKGFSFDGLLGVSPLTFGRQSIGTALAAEETAGRTYKNALLTQSYISAPNYLKPDQKAQAKAILADYAGAINAGKTPLLEGGWKVETIGLNPEDAQLLETRSFNVETLCRWFGVQPVMIGRMEKSTAWGTGLEQMNMWFLQYGLMPWLRRIEQAISRCLLSPADRQRFSAKHNVDALLRGDSASRAAFYTAALQNGWMAANEVRAKENLPPDPSGDVLTVQAQMIPRADVGKAAVQPTFKPVPGGQPPPAPRQPDTMEDDDD